jgi:putative DNA base modification enzyme with NMAD domain
VTIFSYVIEHDLGFAPNPFHGVCTLACCKPEIRKKAAIGDYILGTGAAKPKLNGHLTFWMRVDEMMSFDEYWRDKRFRSKKPIMSGTTYLRYGDNIYHRDGRKDFKQEDSFHSLEDGSVSLANLRRDTGTTDKVLIGRDFAYWGRSGIVLPDHLKCFLKKGPGHRCIFTDEQIAALTGWLNSLPRRGYIDEPAHWQFLNAQKPKKARKVRKERP